jgi:hypothetical protein
VIEDTAKHSVFIDNVHICGLLNDAALNVIGDLFNSAEQCEAADKDDRAPRSAPAMSLFPDGFSLGADGDLVSRPLAVKVAISKDQCLKMAQLEGEAGDPEIGADNLHARND